MNEFRRTILKIDKPRKHKIRNSIGVYDAYKYLRKNKWKDVGRRLTEHEFYTIIRKINNLLADELLNGNDITLPSMMGKLELRKYDSKIYIKDGKVKSNLPIDWDSTLKLWSEDEEAFKNKSLIKMEEKELFKVLYNKSRASYENKSFYAFEVNRDLKVKLKQKIKSGAIDAFKLQWRDTYQ